MGLLFALIALMAWGVGDFLIQKSTRKFGTLSKKLINLFLGKNDEKFSNWIVLFYMSLFGAIVILPFIYQEIFLLELKQILLLVLVSLVILMAALFNFKALKIGKISVIEPIFVLEIPIVVLLASVVIHEILSLEQYLLIFSLVIGIILVSTKNIFNIRNFILEKGVLLAIIGTLSMGLGNFLVGMGARISSPLMTNWFLNSFIAVFSFLYLIKQSKIKTTINYFKENKKLILSTCFFDNAAWVAYAYSMLYIPMAIATGITESYIVLASVLGLIFNKEKLKTHQIVGFVLSVFSAITLAFMIEI